MLVIMSPLGLGFCVLAYCIFLIFILLMRIGMQAGSFKHPLLSVDVSFRDSVILSVCPYVHARSLISGRLIFMKPGMYNLHIRLIGCF